MYRGCAVSEVEGAAVARRIESFSVRVDRALLACNLVELDHALIFVL